MDGVAAVEVRDVDHDRSPGSPRAGTRRPARAGSARRCRPPSPRGPSPSRWIGTWTRTFWVIEMCCRSTCRIFWSIGLRCTSLIRTGIGAPGRPAIGQLQDLAAGGDVPQHLLEGVPVQRDRNALLPRPVENGRDLLLHPQAAGVTLVARLPHLRRDLHRTHGVSFLRLRFGSRPHRRRPRAVVSVRTGRAPTSRRSRHGSHTKSELSERSSWILRMASPRRRLTVRIRSDSQRSSGRRARVSVTTTSRTGASCRYAGRLAGEDRVRRPHVDLARALARAGRAPRSPPSSRWRSRRRR